VPTGVPSFVKEHAVSDKPKLVTDKIREEAAVLEREGDLKSAIGLRQIADEMDNDKNGSLHGPGNPYPRG
jgi:hypothetical protein